MQEIMLSSQLSLHKRKHKVTLYVVFDYNMKFDNLLSISPPKYLRSGLISLNSGYVSVFLEPTANMSSKRAKTKTTKKRPQRATSNVFAMFDQSQIQEFKEAFNMIDQNRDGFIDKEDLHDMLASLGNVPLLFTVAKQIYYN